MTKVSIIIVNYNGQSDTLECLQSLAKINLSNLSVQVVVVDNGSKQKFDVGNFKYEQKNLTLEVLASEQNLGFTGGNNLGIRHAFQTFDPDFILLLNNDTTVDEQFLVQLVKFAVSKENIGAVCPLIYFTKGREFHAKSYQTNDLGKVVWFAGGSIDWKGMYAFHRGVDEVDRGQFAFSHHQSLKKSKESKFCKHPQIDYMTMDFATGCCVLLPTKVLKAVGLFDDDYFLYWEDVDLSWRIKLAGYELYLHSEAQIWHKNAGSSGGAGSKLHQQYQEKNRLKFARKYGGWKWKVRKLKEVIS